MQERRMMMTVLGGDRGTASAEGRLPSWEHGKAAVLDVTAE